ncbi:MAG: IS701 family transposase [Planctomycetes bacterium]|nr:IS701 family transposase [Planctomycetota bacterium]
MAHTSAAPDRRFRAYLERLSHVLGHRDRHGPLRAYLTGLCLPGERKSIEPMAARVDPRHVQARHQSMHHFVAHAPWDDAAVLRIARDWVVEPMERHGPVAAWIVDDTSIPKKGRHSVGVARQYCGALGKQENCQVAVTLNLANEAVSIPVVYRLCLPEGWANDRRRRRAAGVPDDVAFQTKWEMALAAITALQREGLPPAPVVADAGYGVVTEFRDALTHRGIPYVVGVSGETTVWPPGLEPLGPRRWSGRGRPPTRLRRTRQRRPVSITTLAAQLAPKAWRTITWRQGTRGFMRSRFAWLRVRPAHRDEHRHHPRPVEWLLIEWPKSEPAPTKGWFSTLPAEVAAAQLVRLAKLRWRVERDYQELKDEFGLDHFEGRSWRGFHHHGSLCIAAYAFLAAERARLSPPEPLSFLRPARLPRGFKPRGAPRAA